MSFIILSLGFFFSNSGFAISKPQNSDCNHCEYTMLENSKTDGYRYIGYLFTGPGSGWVNIYTDGYYYFWSPFRIEECYGDREGCRPERIYKDNDGWYIVRSNNKNYLYYINDNGDYCLAQSIERDAHRR